MNSLTITNSTSLLLNVTVVGPKGSSWNYWELEPGNAVRFKQLEEVRFAIAAFHEYDNSLIHLGSSRPGLINYNIVRNQFEQIDMEVASRQVVCEIDVEAI